MILVIAIILTSVELVSSQLNLSICVKNEVRFHCSTDGFNKRAYEFIALQIMKREIYSEDEHVLATVDSASDTASVSAYLNSSTNCVASGHLNQKGLGSRLMLNFAEYEVDGGEAYFCRILYMDHPADVNLLTWNSDELFLKGAAKSEEMISAPGFSLKLAKGVQTRCEDVDVDTSAVGTFMIDAATKGLPFICWDKYDSSISCSPRQLETSHETKWPGSEQEAHLPGITCKQQLPNWICNVSTSYSQKKYLSFERCQHSNGITKAVSDWCGVSGATIALSTVSVLIVLFSLAFAMLYVYRRKIHHMKEAKPYCPTTKAGDADNELGTKCEKKQMENNTNKLGTKCEKKQMENNTNKLLVLEASENAMERTGQDYGEEDSPALCNVESPEGLTDIDLGVKIRGSINETYTMICIDECS